jgi:MFS family permease
MLIGGFVCSWTADRWGRKIALVGALVWNIAGIIGQLLSTTRIAFLMSKLILGIGLGFYLTIGPMVTSELTPVVLRGMATAGVNLGIALGQLLSNSVVAGFGARTDRWAYRAPFAFQLAFAAIMIVGFPFAPESPVYLCKKGRDADAEKVLRKLWGNKIDVSAKLVALRETIAEEQGGKQEVSLIDCFRGTNITRTMISMGVFVCQHAVGIVFVLGFSSCKLYFLRK